MNPLNVQQQLDLVRILAGLLATGHVELAVLKFTELFSSASFDKDSLELQILTKVLCVINSPAFLPLLSITYGVDLLFEDNQCTTSHKNN